MAEKDIIRHMIAQPGQSQEQRMPVELGEHFADVDERSEEDLLHFAGKFTGLVNFYQDQTASPLGHWEDFFPSDPEAIHKLMNDPPGNHPPHLALYLSFLRLYQKGPREVINRITGRHLEFFYKDILRFGLKSPVPDKAHLILELKKNTQPITIGPNDLLTVGKDASGIELLYAPTRETVINQAKLESILSIYYEKKDKGLLTYAPVANSSDGLGGKLIGPEPAWEGFGSPGLPPLETGFAFAAPVLRMREGTRKVSISVRVDNADATQLTEASMKGSLEAYVSGEKSWMGPYSLSPKWTEAGLLTFDFTVPASEKAIVNYDSAIHGCRYTASAPVVQLLLSGNSSPLTAGYSDFSELHILSASIDVEASGVTGLSLENDNGSLDPKKAFSPFGQQPVRGSKLLLGCEEVLSKNISEISLDISWKNPPANFATHYQAYGVSVNNNSFTTKADFSYGEGKSFSDSGVYLFDQNNAANPVSLKFIPGQSTAPRSYPAGKGILALRQSGSTWSNALLLGIISRNPVLTLFPVTQVNPVPGFITLTLNRGFYHSEYLRKSVENAVNFAKSGTGTYTALNEPYTPVVQQISLSYKASSGVVQISSGLLDDFSNDDLQFFHIAYTGQMREHTFQRQQFSFLPDTSVSLFPTYSNEGEMILGFSNLQPGESVSVLFQVAEGSENPDLPQQAISWSVLSDNYWKPMLKSEVVLDTTNNLLRSGIIQFILPTDATTHNQLLPPGFIWIKAGIASNKDAVCKLIAVEANAIEVEFRDNGNGNSHLLTALEKDKITKFKNGNASVKSIRQPYHSFAGKAVESATHFNTRVAERLRHKNRAITAWDHERMILEAFPEVHKVKCIQHSRYFEETGTYCWLAPGHLLVIVVPDLRNKNAVDPLRPRVNGDTISRIKAFLQKHSGMQTEIQVRNPGFQQIRVECKVRFHAGYEFNFYSKKLSEELVRFLSPWAFDSRQELLFGSSVYKSVLLNFVEERPYVDYLEDFYLYSIGNGNQVSGDSNLVEPSSPDTLLVSAPYHHIHEAS